MPFRYTFSSNVGVIPLGAFVVLGLASLILDQLSLAPSVVYSLRKMRNAYTGSAIRVRRSSDNAEANIGFTAGGDLDETALLAHCGASSGFVTTMYDQMTGGYNATQVTAGNQPRVVLNGVIDKHLGRPKLVQPSGVAMSLRTAPVPRTSHASAMNAVVPNNGTFMRPFHINDEDYSRFVDGFTYCQMNQTIRTNEIITNIPTAGSSILTTVNNTTQFVFFRDGTQQTIRGLSGSYDSNPAPITILWNSPPANEQTMQEAMYFQGVLTTADRQLLERNQGTYYSTTVA